MKKSQIKAFIILAFMLSILLFNSFITKIFSQYSICAFILSMGIISYFILGYQKEKSRYNKDIILSILIYIAIYYITTYLLGLFIGFSRNIYSINMTNLINNIVPLIILIPIAEIYRYIINNKIKNNYWLLSLSVLAFSMIDVTFTLSAINFNDFYSILKTFGLFILPSIAKNFMLTYISFKVSYKPNIIYRYLIEIPKYILPIIPNFGAYIESVIYFTFPILVFIMIYNNFKKREKVIISSKKNKRSKIIYTIAILLIVIMVGLTSGYFKYQAIVIATGSMTPNINKGDIVIVEKLNEKEILNLKKSHIGYYLIDKGKEELLSNLINKKVSFMSNKTKAKLYVSTILVISILITLEIIIYVNKEINNIFFSIILGLFISVPVQTIVVQIIQYILSKMIKPKMIPKLDFSGGIPEEDSTIVIIPTILKSRDKTEELMKKLEVYYLANKSENLYFALLGDAVAAIMKRKNLMKRL